MTRGSINARWEKFIKLMVTVDNVAGMIKVYKLCYPTCKKDESARVGAYTLLQNPTIVRRIDKLKREREEKIEQVRQEELIKAAKAQVASELELDATLSQIATGRFRKKKLITAYDSSKGQFMEHVIEERPDETAMISAADKLYRRKGSYAATTIKHEGDSFISFMKALASKSNENIPNGIQPRGNTEI